MKMSEAEGGKAETNGWIKFQRKSFQSVVWQTANLWKVWCWALLRANRQETNILFQGQELVLKAGQFVSGRFAGAEECNMSASTFRNQIATLSRIRNLDIKTDRHKSIFTIVKWSQYQSTGKGKDNEEDNGWTTGGHRQEEEKERSTVPVFFSGEGFTVTEEDRVKYQRAFQLNDDTLRREFCKMEAWLKDKGKTMKNYRRFITNWLGKIPAEKSKPIPERKTVDVSAETLQRLQESGQI